MYILLHFHEKIFIPLVVWHVTLFTQRPHGSNPPEFDILIPLVCDAGYHGHFIYPSIVGTKYKSNGCISRVSCVGYPKQKGSKKNNGEMGYEL